MNSNTYLKECEKVNIKTKTLQSISPIPNPVAEFGCVADKNNIYVFGGDIGEATYVNYV